MNHIYVFDDEGTFAIARLVEFDSEQEAALNVIEEVVTWTEEEGEELYSSEQCRAHLKELEQLTSDVKGHAVDVLQPNWFESVLGFTFSYQVEVVDDIGGVDNDTVITCGKYPQDEVLPNEEGRCSLCGSELSSAGECGYGQ